MGRRRPRGRRDSPFLSQPSQRVANLEFSVPAGKTGSLQLSADREIDVREGLFDFFDPVGERPQQGIPNHDLPLHVEDGEQNITSRQNLGIGQGIVQTGKIVAFRSTGPEKGKGAVGRITIDKEGGSGSGHGCHYRRTGKFCSGRNPVKTDREKPLVLFRIDSEFPPQEQPPAWLRSGGEEIQNVPLFVSGQALLFTLEPGYIFVGGGEYVGKRHLA